MRMASDWVMRNLDMATCAHFTKEDTESAIKEMREAGISDLAIGAALATYAGMYCDEPSHGHPEIKDPWWEAFDPEVTTEGEENPPELGEVYPW